MMVGENIKGETKMPLPLIKKAAQKYTWSDYLTWPAEERWEIINGVAYNMTPAPSVRHQIIAVKIVSQLEQKLKNKRYNLLLPRLM